MDNHLPVHNREAASRVALYRISAFLLLVFVTVIGYLTNVSFQLNEKITRVDDEYNNVHTLYDELEKQFEEILEELDYYVGVSEEMNLLIEMQKEELAARRLEIATFIQDYHDSQLEFARMQIRGLKEVARLFLLQIEQLQQVNDILFASNNNLKDQKKNLHTQLDRQQTENDQVAATTSTLVSQRDDLKRAVLIGSVISVKDIKVQGLKVRPNGKAKKRKSSRRVDELKVCFTATANEVVNAGTETFFIRIVNPRGETLSNEDLGSGNIRLQASGDKVPITSGKEINYQNAERDLCLSWTPRIAFIPGSYQVEVYNKGFLAGTSGFNLR